MEYYHDFDLSRSVIMEKADGSLVGVYHHNGKWHISTRGMAFAEGEHVMGGTFRDKVRVSRSKSVFFSLAMVSIAC